MTVSRDRRRRERRLAELTEEITRRLEAGETVNGDDLERTRPAPARSANSCPRCERWFHSASSVARDRFQEPVVEKKKVGPS